MYICNKDNNDWETPTDTLKMNKKWCLLEKNIDVKKQSDVTEFQLFKGVTLELSLNTNIKHYN